MEPSNRPKQVILHGGKHVMLSYNWNSQDIVTQIYHILKDEQIPLWFDIQGDMKQNIYDRYVLHTNIKIIHVVLVWLTE